MDVIDINTLFGAFPSEHATTSAASLVEVLETADVQQAFSLSTCGLYYSDTQGNQETLEAAAAYPARLVPVATINPLHYLGDRVGLQRLAIEHPFPMFRFFPSLQGWPIDFAPFTQVVMALSEYGKPLLERAITIPTPARGWRLLVDGGKPIMVRVDRPGDATMLARVLDDYPAPVILESVCESTLAEAIAVMRMRPHFLLETHALRVSGALGRVRDSVGTDRILFGSGAPTTSLGAALAYVQRSKLSDTDKEKVLHGNTYRLLKGAP